MKVLYLVNQYPKNSHTFVRREIRGVEELGIEVVRVSIRPAIGPFVEAEDQEEAERTHALLGSGAKGLLPSVLAVACTRPLKFLSAVGRTFRLARGAERGLGVHFAYLAEACALLRICRREKVDHIHVHFATNPPLVAMLVKSLGGPGFSFTAHGSEEYYRALSLKLADKVADAKFVAAISRFGRSQLQLFAAPEIHDRIHIVHCGLDAAFLDDDPIPPPSGNRLLFVGRLCQQKQPQVLLQAVAQLVEQGLDFHLDIIGDGELTAAVEASVSALGLQDHVTLHGTVDGAGVRDAIRRSRAMVMSSSAEGLPVVLMESMALQRPVVTTCIAAIPELVRQDVEGWLVPTGDASALADAMRHALECPDEQLARMGAAAGTRARSRHDIRVSAERMVDLFHRYGAQETA
ncbi:MAG: glycosyltransferase [Planctomycetota bacterium]|jgi:glycosyltransferase involved in cell wall biosynthesis